MVQEFHDKQYKDCTSTKRDYAVEIVSRIFKAVDRDGSGKLDTKEVKKVGKKIFKAIGECGDIPGITKDMAEKYTREFIDSADCDGVMI